MVGKGWVFITSSGWKNSANAANGGVGVIFIPRANASLKNIEKINPRIIVATFTGNPARSMICCTVQQTAVRTRLRNAVPKNIWGSYVGHLGAIW